MSVNRLSLNRGHEKQFMQLDWGGWNGRIVTIIFSYVLAVAFVFIMGAPLAAVFGLALPLAFTAYFATRPPISIVTVAAIAAVAISVGAIRWHYADADWLWPWEPHKASDHAMAPEGPTWRGLVGAGVVGLGGGLVGMAVYFGLRILAASVVETAVNAVRRRPVRGRRRLDAGHQRDL